MYFVTLELVKPLRLKNYDRARTKRKGSQVSTMRHWKESDTERLSFCKAKVLALATLSY